jgi:hypothetical protein
MLPDNYSCCQHWRHAVKFMLDAAVDGSNITAASKQIELALLLDMRLDVKKTSFAV